MFLVGFQCVVNALIAKAGIKVIGNSQVNIYLLSLYPLASELAPEYLCIAQALPTVSNIGSNVCWSYGCQQQCSGLHHLPYTGILAVYVLGLPSLTDTLMAGIGKVSKAYSSTDLGGTAQS